MIKFREKTFSKKGLMKAVSYIKKYPILPISAASLGIGIANNVNSKKKLEDSLKLQKRQIVAMENLAKALNDTKKIIEKESKSEKSKKNSSSPKFKEKKKKK